MHVVPAGWLWLATRKAADRLRTERLGAGPTGRIGLVLGTQTCSGVGRGSVLKGSGNAWCLRVSSDKGPVNQHL